jgi:hypothetical protein
VQFKSYKKITKEVDIRIIFAMIGASEEIQARPDGVRVARIRATTLKSTAP